jgi:hypothetical protein
MVSFNPNPNPKPKHQNPNTKDQNPKTKDQTPNKVINKIRHLSTKGKIASYRIGYGVKKV